MKSVSPSRDRGSPLTPPALALLLVAVVLTSAFAGPVAAQSSPTAEFVVQVRADGSATVTVTSVFDLTTDDERRAFRSLQNDSTAQADARDRFVARMRTIANDTQAATGREMAVTDGRIELATTPDGDAGIVTLSVTWTGLAAQRDGQLVVTEPFASAFSPDRRFVLRAPAGYHVSSASPAPTTGNDTRAVWQAGSELAGFEVVIEPAPTPTASPTATPSPSPTAQTETPGQPGFGFIGAGVALLAGWALAARRRG